VSLLALPLSFASASEDAGPANEGYFIGAPERSQFSCGREGTEACVERLRAALRRELKKPELALVKSSHACHDEETLPCVPTFDQCMPLAGAIVERLGDLGVMAEAAAPELEGALDRGNSRLTDIAFQALGQTGSAYAVPLALKRLASPEVTCRSTALRALEQLGPSAGPAVPKLIDLVERGDWHDRAEAAALLGQLHHRTAIPALREALRHEPASAQRAAAEALARFGNDATNALPDLKALAARHWSWNVRKAAAEAAASISGEKILPRAPACRTHPVEFDGNWQVGSWRLHPLQPSLNPSGSCSSVKATPGTTILIPEGAVCLVGEDRGEWGGSISAVRAMQHTELRGGWDVNPASAIRFPGGYLVVERLRHVTLSKGIVSRLTRDGQGSWHAEQLVELPGFPFSHALTQDGKLLLLTDTHEEPCPGDPRTKTTIAPVYLLSIAWDGTVESLP
jgi:hypothetical protein